LDLETLVCTRGRDFPITRIAQRLRCPSCGCRETEAMVAEVPKKGGAGGGMLQMPGGGGMDF
jgi:hypothetical protein